MTIRESEELLFAQWRLNRLGFVADGDADESAYLASAPKLLFLLKEVNDPGGGNVSVNSFLDTRGSKIMRHQPKSIVAHVLPGQGLYSHAVQSARSHCIDAETHAAPGGVLPRYQRSGAIRDSPSVYG